MEYGPKEAIDHSTAQTFIEGLTKGQLEKLEDDHKNLVEKAYKESSGSYTQADEKQYCYKYICSLLKSDAAYKYMQLKKHDVASFKNLFKKFVENQKEIADLVKTIGVVPNDTVTSSKLPEIKINTWVSTIKIFQNPFKKKEKDPRPKKNKAGKVRLNEFYRPRNSDKKVKSKPNASNSSPVKVKRIKR